MKTDKLTLKDENGELAVIERKNYVKLLVKEYEVKDLQTSDGPSYAAEKVVDHIVKKTMEGMDISDEIAAEESYAELIERVRADVKDSEENTVSKKEEAAKKKEEKEKEKEAAKIKAEKEALELAKRQEVTGIKIKAGADAAADDFTKELQNLREQLPESIKLVGSGDRTAINVDDASEEELAETLGFLAQKSSNSEWLNNQVQFWIGDIVNGLVRKGVYKTQKDAGEAVTKMIGTTYAASSVSYYAKMADRTPAELRNVQVQPTAYLAIANCKLPKKGDKETDADFKTRVAKFEEGRRQLQEKLSSGEITTRSGIVPHVEDFLIASGLKQKKDPNEMSLTDHFKVLYHTSVALEHLLGTHEEGVVIYRTGEDEYKLTEEQLTEMRDESMAALHNHFYSNPKKKITLRDYEKGNHTEIKKSIKKKGDGAEKVDEEVVIKLYPEPFWNVEEEKKEEQSEG